MNNIAPNRWQDPAVLARISNLELIARTLVEGFVSGVHRSARLGQSVDFAEHRAYLPGDDLRHIDWRVFARSDRLYVKQYEADTNASLCLLLDVSASMSYAGTTTVSKLDYACMLGASLLYLGQQQRDRVGLLTFADKIIDYIPPAVRHYDRALHTLSHLRQGQQGQFAEPLRTAAERLRQRGLIVVLSDFYHPPELMAQLLGEYRLRGHDVIVFHILAAEELDFPFDQASIFQDLETGEQLTVNTSKLAQPYRERIRHHRDQLQKSLGRQRVDYTLLRTDQPLDWGLYHYLNHRAGALR